MPACKVQQLKDWVHQNDGYVHPELVLGTSPAYGCRGVVAQAAIPTTQPLITIPEKLTLSTGMARQKLSQLVGLNSVMLLESDKSGVMLLAVLLAHERRLPDSFWAPHLALLPETPPNPWFMQPEQLQNALQSAPAEQGEHWSRQVDKASDSASAATKTLTRVFGWPLNLGEGDIAWGLGQVLSRHFGRGKGADKECFMLPFIDMCNHSFVAQEHTRTMTPEGTPAHSVSAVHNNVAHSLEAGQELLIKYADREQMPGISTLINFGFVAQ